MYMLIALTRALIFLEFWLVALQFAWENQPF